MDSPSSGTDLSDEDVERALAKIGKKPLGDTANTYANPCSDCGRARSALVKNFAGTKFECAQCLDRRLARTLLRLHR